MLISEVSVYTVTWECPTSVKAIIRDRGVACMLEGKDHFGFIQPRRFSLHFEVTNLYHPS